MRTKTGLLSLVSRRAGFLLLAGGLFWAGSARADHTLVAHFAFDTTDAQNDVQGTDSSGNGNDMTYGAGGGDAGAGVFVTSDAAAGPLAIRFSAGTDGTGLGVLSWTIPPTELFSTLAGSFTVSCWIKTSQVFGSEGDPAYYGAGIVAADVPGPAFDVVPIALTGGEIAFTTGNGGPSDDTLSSMDDNVNDGKYHLVTVTRNMSTGDKIIYIDGKLDNTGFGTTSLLDSPQQIDIGSIGNGGNPNPVVSDFYGQYVGDLDDLQFYSGVLNANEVAFLYHNPGSTVPDVSYSPIVPNLVAHYAFDDSSNIGADTSGNGNDLDFNSAVGGGNGVAFSASAEAGAGAAYFDGGSFLTYSGAPASVLSTLASSFTLSVWINTTTTVGQDGDLAFHDQGIVACDIPGLAKDSVPMSLTGSGIGFNTGDDPAHFQFGDDTLSSYANVADGTYHHVVVTRDEATGIKQIYIDGNLNVSDTAATYYLRDPVEIGVGAQINGSRADPNLADIGGPYYQGLLDDIQLYNRVLTADEITYLHLNPGNVVAGASPAPVDADVGFEIYYTIDPTYGGYYFAFPYISSLSPAPTTTNFVSSPNRAFISSQSPSGGSPSGNAMASLSDIIDEFTNGYWSIVVNEGATNEQIFHFQASVSGLTTNLLSPVQILVPANGATAVATNTPFQWNGPAGFSLISVSEESSNSANQFFNTFDPPATNWPSPPEAYPGTNNFSVTYVFISFPGVTFSSPVDSASSSPSTVGPLKRI